MDSQSRTTKSLKNSVIAMIFYVVNLVLQFFSRKLFLEYLGTEILGLNTTAMNLLQFLNLAELGISSAVGFTLYKPIYDDNRQMINEIVTLQGHLYRRIAWIIIGGAIILMCFFPWIFSKMDLPLWYAYASFGILLFSALLGYFVNYRQIVLSASQQDYKIQYSYKSIMIVKVACQMLAVYRLPHGYVWWLILEGSFAAIASWTLHRMTLATFPFLNTVNDSFRTLRVRYPEFTTKIKQLFFHKIGGFALTQSSPIIIYAYASLNVVTLYGNYILITTGIQGLVSAIFNSMSAGVGNLVAEGNRQSILKVFDELFCIRFLIAATLCYCVYTLTPSFISLWIGSQFILPDSTLILVDIVLFISLVRLTVDNFINAYGLFSDIWAPIAEAVLNIGCSILLGYYYNLNGIIAGVILSQVIIIIMWKPYFLFTKGLKGALTHYWKMFVINLIAALSMAYVAMHIVQLIQLDFFSNFGSFIIIGAINLIVYSFILLIALFLVTSGMRDFVYRFVKKVI